MKLAVVILAWNLLCASSDYIPVISEKMKSCGSTGVFDLSSLELVTYNDTVLSSFSLDNVRMTLKWLADLPEWKIEVHERC